MTTFNRNDLVNDLPTLPPTPDVKAPVAFKNSIAATRSDRFGVCFHTWLNIQLEWCVRFDSVRT